MRLKGGKAVLFVLFSVPLRPQTSTPVLQPGVPVERKLAAGATDSFLLRAAAGDLVEVTIDQTGDDLGVIATLTGPDGVPIQSGPSYHLPHVSLMAVAARPGDYRIELRPLTPPDAQYRIRAAAPRPATAQDQARAAAWTTLLEGNQLFAQYPKLMSKPREPVLKGIGLFQKAAAGFRSIGDRLGEAAALFLVGLAYRFINDRPPDLGEVKMIRV